MRAMLLGLSVAFAIAFLWFAKEDDQARAIIASTLIISATLLIVSMGKGTSED